MKKSRILPSVVLTVILSLLIFNISACGKSKTGSVKLTIQNVQ